MTSNYLNPGPTREDIDTMKGPLMLEFGVDWCPHCIGAQPLAEKTLAEFPEIKHIQVEDGKGRRLGRSFSVKLWPTFVFLKDGVEAGRAVRPTSIEELADKLKAIL